MGSGSSSGRMRSKDRFDVFLSHDWGLDQHRRDNHERARKLKSKLEASGLSVWFDEERMRGNITSSMAEGIDESTVVLVCITSRYVQKVYQDDRMNDNCKLEFQYAMNRKTAANMMAVVMEEGMKDTSAWVGPVGMAFGNVLYHDLSSDDSPQFEDALDKLTRSLKDRQIDKFKSIAPRAQKTLITDHPHEDNKELIAMQEALSQFQTECHMQNAERALEELFFLRIEAGKCCGLGIDKTVLLIEMADFIISSESKSMPVNLKLNALGALKIMALHNIQQGSSASKLKLICSRFEAFLERKASDERKVITEDKLFYVVAVILRLWQAHLTLVEAALSNSKKSRVFSVLLPRISAAARNDLDDVDWFIAKGIKFCLDLAIGEDSKIRCFAEIFTLEHFADILAKSSESQLSAEKVNGWVGDIFVFLNQKCKHFDPESDWLVILNCIDFLLAAASRFSSLQESVLLLFREPFELKFRSSWNPVKALKMSPAVIARSQSKLNFVAIEAVILLSGRPNLSTTSMSQDILKHWELIDPTALRFAQQTTLKSVPAVLPLSLFYIFVRFINGLVDTILQKAEETNAIISVLTGGTYSGIPKLLDDDLVNALLVHIPQQIMHDLATWTLQDPYICSVLSCRVFIRSLMLVLKKSPQNFNQSGLEVSALQVMDNQEYAAQINNAKPKLSKLIASVQDEKIFEKYEASYDDKDLEVLPAKRAVIPTIGETNAKQILQSIYNIVDFVTRGQTDCCIQDKLNIVVLGVTGSGKSTLVNGLAGCKLEQISPSEAKLARVSLDSIQVVSVADGGPCNAVTNIGQSRESETKVLHPIFVNDSDFVLWDAPGFEDTNGAEDNIANSINLFRLLNASQRNGLVIIVVLDVGSLESCRGVTLNRTIKILIQLFGNDKTKLVKNMEGVLFCVTKAGKRYALETLQDWIVEAGRQADLNLNDHIKRMVMFDPLNTNPEGLDSVRLNQVIMDVVPISAKQGLFLLSLTGDDHVLLSKMLLVLSNEVLFHMKRADFAAVSAHLDTFSILQIIPHETITESTGRIIGSIIEHISSWSLQIQAINSDYSPQARIKIKTLLSQLKKCQVLAKFLQKTGFSVEDESSKAYEAVRIAENAEQQRENQLLILSFTEAYQRLDESLINCIRSEPVKLEKWFDIEHISPFKSERSRTSNPSLTSFEGHSEAALMVAFLDKAQITLFNRGPNRKYIFGDQTDLKAKLSQFQKDADLLVKNKLSLFLENQFTECLKALDQNTTEAVKESLHCEFLATDNLNPGMIADLSMHGFENKLCLRICVLMKYTEEHFPNQHESFCNHMKQTLSRVQIKARERFLKTNFSARKRDIQRFKDQMMQIMDEKSAQIVKGEVILSDEFESTIKADCSRCWKIVLKLARDDIKVTAAISDFDAIKELTFQELNREAQKTAAEKIHGLLEDKRRKAIEEISKILAKGEFEAEHGDLCTALKHLYEVCNELGSINDYKSCVADTTMRLNGLQSESEIQNFLTNGNYNGLVSRYRMLFGLNTKLKPHVHLDLQFMSQETKKHTDQLISKAFQEVRQDVDAPSYLSIHYLRSCISILSTLESVVTLGDLRKSLSDEVNLAVDRSVGELRILLFSTEIEEISRESQNKIAKLLIKGYGMTSELSGAAAFTGKIRDLLLSKLSSKEKYWVGNSLMAFVTYNSKLSVPDSKSSSSNDDAELARAILETFPEFRIFSIELFNSKTGSVSFEVALANLKCEPPRKPISKLENAFRSYQKVYSDILNRIIKDIVSFSELTNIDECLGKINDMSKQLMPHARGLGQECELFGEFLARISAHWTFLAAKKNPEGLETKYVLQPHSVQVLGIFRLLGIDEDNLAHHLIQIDTGEGKSIAIGFTACILAKLGFKVDVVCYSEYLSNRDFKAFEELFADLQIIESISYSDFRGLAEKEMTDDSSRIPNMRDVFLSYLKKKKHVRRTDGDERPRILLFDEVDVFFSDKFFGKTYNPIVKIPDEESFLVLDYIWKNRGSLRNDERSINEVMRLDICDCLAKSYPNLLFILEVEIAKMLAAVNDFPISGNPVLSDASAAYIVDDKSQKIGYVNAITGIPEYTTYYGYTTDFTYLYLVDKGRITQNTVSNLLRIHPRCGALSYSEIPNLYDVCLGMTGTLDCLSAAQQHLLNSYQFHRKTFLPSAFKKKGLNKEYSKPNMHVIHGSWDEYFGVLINEIQEELVKGRAMLIVFEDMAKLDRFARELRVRYPKIPQYTPPLELTDTLQSKERDSVIVRAIRRFTITLVTRSYGRGTDFVCRDQGLIKNGGVHIITTFFPEDESENKQIIGRTCRQDDPGSAVKILFLEYLSDLEASENAKEASAMDWDSYLKDCRSRKAAARNAIVMKEAEKLRANHLLTLDACAAVESGNWTRATNFYTEIRKMA